ncbi:helix-turn-helix domain-containing protein [Kitasatospora sp. NPDC004289]
MAVDPDSIAARVKTRRLLRGLTQRELADQAQVSLSTVRQIEQGTRQPSDSVLAALARALRVPVADLAVGPGGDDLDRDQVDGLIRPIRAALDLHDLGADPEIHPRPATELVQHAEQLCRSIRDGHLRAVAGQLPGLLEELTTAVHLTGAPRLFIALSTAYRSAYDVAAKLSYHDLAATALDRMAWAAERGSDPAAAGVQHYLRTMIHLRAGSYRTGLRVADAGLRTAALTDTGNTRTAVTGQIHLSAALLNGRQQKPDAAADHLAEARRIAAGVSTYSQQALVFGATNTAVHEVSTLVDQHLYREALDVARTVVVPSGWPVSRTARHYTDVARAALFTGNPDTAFHHLAEARRLAPQPTRFSPGVREVLSGVIRSRRTVPVEVTRYAAWLGL